MESITEYHRREFEKILKEHDLSYALVFDAADGMLNTWFMGWEKYGGGPENDVNLPTLSPFNRSSVYIVPAEGEILCYSAFWPHPTDPRQYPECPVETLDAVFSGGKIGIIHPEQMKTTFRDRVMNSWPGLELMDITSEFEVMKACRCEEEIREMERDAILYDRCFSAFPLLLRPGRTEHDVAVDIRFRLLQMGAEAEDLNQLSVVKLFSGSQLTKSDKTFFEYPGKALACGDRVDVTVIGYLPGGYCSAMGRSFTLGPAAEETKHLWEIAVEAQDYAASLLKPGETIKDIQNKLFEKIYRPNHLNMTDDLNIWGVGTSYHEPPYIGDEYEDFPLEKGMTLAVGPVIDSAETDPIRCLDVYTVGENGGIRLNHSERKLIELQD